MTMVNKIGIVLLIGMLALNACMEKGGSDETKDGEEVMKRKVALMEIDKAFAKASLEKGMTKAFTEYIDSNGVLLRPDNLPIIGADAVDFLSQLNEDEYTLVWEPKGVEVSVSNDMGFTYGIYSIRAPKQDSTFSGTYVNVWRKQTNGSWRFVLNSGNSGLSAVPEN